MPDNKSRDDDWIVIGFGFVFFLGLWLGFAMGSGGVCNQRATLISFGTQIYYTFLGEPNAQP